MEESFTTYIEVKEKLSLRSYYYYYYIVLLSY